jgi:hypothetical protein
MRHQPREKLQIFLLLPYRYLILITLPVNNMIQTQDYFVFQLHELLVIYILCKISMKQN